MKNYKKINVYSQNDFDEKMYRLGLYSYNVNEVKDDKAFISIIGTEECRKCYLEEDTIHWFSNSRSIAVATYILDMYGEEYGYNEKESCRKDNPCKTPNINVLTKLKRAYYKKFNIYES